ncbi:monovalent cation/H+ antiporter complex subunit F [Isoptericola aurantiacus]|uniref:monovalent cation/H+ antiporter complex subunit F n=1 Tax=Isoptericola aurantiacus TaxID=3377839 RepID=UPI00383BD53D
MDVVMTVVVAAAAVLVAAAAVLALVRVERGPSMLDRAIGLDLLAAALVGVIAIEAAWLRRTETIPILVALSLVGFVGSVAIARFAAREPAAPRRRDDAPGEPGVAPSDRDDPPPAPESLPAPLSGDTAPRGGPADGPADGTAQGPTDRPAHDPAPDDGPADRPGREGER